MDKDDYDGDEEKILDAMLRRMQEKGIQYYDVRQTDDGRNLQTDGDQS